MDLLLDLLDLAARSFFGALAGVFWPARTAAWRKRQLAGLAAAIVAAALFALAFYLASEGWTPLVWFLLGAGGIFAACYLVIGNQCRRYHEAAHRDRPG